MKLIKKQTQHNSITHSYISSATPNPSNPIFSVAEYSADTELFFRDVSPSLSLCLSLSPSLSPFLFSLLLGFDWLMIANLSLDTLGISEPMDLMNIPQENLLLCFNAQQLGESTLEWVG